LTAEQVEGPFFFDTSLLRQNITEGKPGVALRLRLQLVAAEGCVPIRDAVVEAWHTDAAGVYSAFDRAQGNIADAAGETFLRGFQVTDASGRVEFHTIYPGWYPGRTIHIHVKTVIDSTHLITTQLYFPDVITDSVLQQPPYNTRGPRDTTNATDAVSRFAGGPGPDPLILTLAEANGGYVGSFLLSVIRL
jgi:protocatechuate 3,4-dioxygenase beta subunit